MTILIKCNKDCDVLKKRIGNKIYICICGNVEKEIKFKKCGRCQYVRYCSRECQIKDWSSHKHVCK